MSAGSAEEADDRISWDRVREPVRRPMRRKAGSVQKPGGRWKDIERYILGVSVGAL